MRLQVLGVGDRIGQPAVVGLWARLKTRHLTATEIPSAASSFTSRWCLFPADSPVTHTPRPGAGPRSPDPASGFADATPAAPPSPWWTCPVCRRVAVRPNSMTSSPHQANSRGANPGPPWSLLNVRALVPAGIEPATFHAPGAQREGGVALLRVAHPPHLGKPLRPGQLEQSISNIPPRARTGAN